MNKGDPVSAMVMARSSSACDRIAACSWRRHRTRSATSVDHPDPSKARRAAARARSAS